MSQLYKTKKVTVVPGNPGSPEIPGHPATEEITISSLAALREYGSFENFYASDLFTASGYEYITFPVIYWESIETIITIPASPAVPSIPAVAPTPTQISYSLNYGWNSWARSIDPLTTGKYFECAIPPSTSGAFIGIGPQGMEAPDIGRFKNGLVFDKTGVKVFESGEVVATLRAPFLWASKMRIFRRSNNEIVYVIVTAKETIVYLSAVKQYRGFVPLYAYGFIYSSGEVINAASLTTGKVSFGVA